MQNALSRYASFVARAAALFALTLSAAPAMAEDFYAGKTIDFVVGNYPGGGYDIYARTIARHMGRYIPGHPAIVVRNMPGAGSSKAAIFVSTMAPRDGTTIAAVTPGAIMATLLDDKPTSTFDASKVNFIGTANQGTRICLTMKQSNMADFKDAQKRKTVIGAVAASDATRDYPFMLKKTADAKLEIISGYKGTTDIALAMERGEVDGACGWDWSSIKLQRADWLNNDRVNVLVQIGLEPNAELTKRGVPMVWDFIKSEDDRKAVATVVTQQIFMRSYFAPPEIPKDRLALLRAAFDATMSDPEFLADAQKSGIDIEAMSGDKVQAIIEKVYATPKAITDRAKDAMRP
jgi:tripartite-type tricarboxylate transporter receptor subunit TctC